MCVGFVLLFSLAFRLTSPKRQLCQLRFSGSLDWSLLDELGVAYKCIMLVGNKRLLNFLSQRKKWCFFESHEVWIISYVRM